MARFSDLHLLLEMAVEKYREDDNDENGIRVVKEMKKLIDTNADLLFEGVEGTGGKTPGGFYAQDGKFYFHVFSSRLHLKELEGEAMHAGAGEIWKMVLDYDIVGGFCLNHKDEAGGILITQEELNEA